MTMDGCNRLKSLINTNNKGNEEEGREGEGKDDWWGERRMMRWRVGWRVRDGGMGWRDWRVEKWKTYFIFTCSEVHPRRPRSRSNLDHHWWQNDSKCSEPSESFHLQHALPPSTEMLAFLFWLGFWFLGMQSTWIDWSILVYRKILFAVPLISSWTFFFKKDPIFSYLSCLGTFWLNTIRMVLRKQWPEHRTLDSFDLEREKTKRVRREDNTFIPNHLWHIQRELGERELESKCALGADTDVRKDEIDPKLVFCVEQ